MKNLTKNKQEVWDKISTPYKSEDDILDSAIIKMLLSQLNHEIAKPQPEQFRVQTLSNVLKTYVETGKL